MPARKWTEEQKARQAALIHTWKPWKQSTGPVTPKGKEVSSKNALNYSLREVSRELARTNRALVGYLSGATPIAPSINQATMDKLLDDVEKAAKAPHTRPAAKNKPNVTRAPKKVASEPCQQESAPVTTEQGFSFFDQIPSSLR